jgi:putative two-component system response regulator
VIGDAALMAAPLREMLAPEFELIETAGAAEGLSLALEARPEVVAVDGRAPAEGLSTCRRLKGDTRTRLLPVMVVASPGLEARIEALEAGADEVLAPPVDRRELRARAANLARGKLLTDRLEDTTLVVFALANAVEAKDAYTEGHTERVGQLSVRMAQRLSLGEDAEDALHKGGILHDIGKIGIPSSIINKPGMLTPAERVVMEKHPMIGERICEPLKSIRDLLPIIRWHHEKLDGTGYPDGLKGDEFPLICQVMQLADIYDAITTDRPYHRARTRDGALEFMLGEAKKGWRDAELVKVCRAAAEDLGFGRMREDEIPPPPAPIHLWRWE